MMLKMLSDVPPRRRLRTSRRRHERGGATHRTWCAAVAIAASPLASYLFNAYRRNESLRTAEVTANLYFFVLMTVLLSKALPSLNQTTPRMFIDLLLQSCRRLNARFRGKPHGEDLGAVNWGLSSST